MRRVTHTLGVVVSMAFMLVGCATVGPPQPPSLFLPQPPTDLRARRKGERIELMWTVPTTTTDRETIRNLGKTLVCRGSVDLTSCDTPAGETNTPSSSGGAGIQKPRASFTDRLPQRLVSDDPSAFITYAVQVSNREGRAAGLSNQVRVSLIRTLPSPREFRATQAKEGVILSWNGDPAPVSPEDVHYIYRVYRHAEGSEEQVLAAEVTVASESSFSTTDTNIEWQRTYYYHAEAVTEIQRPNQSQLEVEGDDSPEIKIFADDVFPPAVPSGLQAVFSGPGQNVFIDLVWAPVTDTDLAGYNVYRREEGTPTVKLNAEVLKVPAYRDENVAPGKKYFYSVTTVDLRSNESRKSEEANEIVP